MHGSRRTGFLLAAAAALLIVHFFPNVAVPVAGLSLALGALWLALVSSRLFAHYRTRRLLASQAAVDESEYRDFQTQLTALRALHYPAGDWLDATEYPPAFKDSLATLHAAHGAMLERRFGSGAAPAEGAPIDEDSSARSQQEHR